MGEPMNFQAAAPKIPPRILCIGMPVRDLTFRIDELPRAASRSTPAISRKSAAATRSMRRSESCASAAAPRSAGRWAMPARPRAKYIFDKLAHEGIETKHIVHMPGLVTPISNIMIDPSGERTIVTFRDPELWKVRLPDTGKLLEDCSAILTENRCAEFCTDLCAEARRRGIPVIVDVDRTMSLREGLLTASSHLVFSSEALQSTAGVRDDAEALKKIAKFTPSFLAGTRGALGTLWLDEQQQPAGDAGLPGAHRGHAGRRRRVPWRICARHHRKSGRTERAPVRFCRCGAQMHPLWWRLCGTATC